VSVTELDVSDVCCCTVRYLYAWTNEYSFLLLVAGPLSRLERPLSATRKNVYEKDPDLSVSAVVKAMQIESKVLQRDLQRQTVSTSPQKVWQNAERGCLIKWQNHHELQSLIH